MKRLPMLAGAAMLLLSGQPSRAALVEVAVTGVGDARGHVHVDLCTSRTFLKEDCPYAGSAPAMPGATVVKIPGVPPGQYAAQVFHDENDDGAVARNLLGIPTEAIGFSNDAPLHIRGPHFSDAAFEVERGVARITLKLRRLFGPSR
ncbi:MAG: DUF2141 domain-containing protein [Caulobacteraceae bacterium]